MIIVSPEIGPFFEKMMRDFESEKDPSKCLATNKAEVKLVENQHSEVLVRGFTVIQDEPQSVMGGGRRPTPTNYIVASVGFCENVIFARNAAVTGLSVESLETSVIRKQDRSGLFEIKGVEPSFTGVSVETKVKTKDSVEKVVSVARQTRKRCPVHATLRKATNLTFKLVVNGEPVSL